MVSVAGRRGLCRGPLILEQALQGSTPGERGRRIAHTAVMEDEVPFAEYWLPFLPAVPGEVSPVQKMVCGTFSQFFPAWYWLVPF